MIDVGTTLEGVRTRLRDGVHTTTDEVGLTDIEGRDHHLHFLNGIDRNRIATARQATAQTEVVVEVGTVNGKVTKTTVTTSEAHAVTSVRRETGEVGNATRHRRHIGNLSAGDVGGGTSLLGSKLRSFSADHHLSQLGSVLRNRNCQIVSLCQLEGYSFDNPWLVTDIGNSYLIRATSTHTLNAEQTRDIRYGCVTSTRRLMQSYNSSTNDFLAVSIVESHLTSHAGSGNLCYSCQRECQQCNNQQKQSFLHKIRTVLIN